MRTVLVTGGGGFIGSNLVAGLLARGDCRVVVCDMFGTGDKWRNLQKHLVAEIVPPVELFSWLEKNHHTLEMIYHTAAASSTVERDVDYILANNFTLPVQLWRWATQNKKRYLYVTSSAVYGDGTHGFEDELNPDYLNKLRPLRGYGWSKLMFDMHVARAHQSGEATPSQWVGLRLFNVYGPNEYHKDVNECSVVTKTAPHAIRGATIKLFKSYHPAYPDGGQKRDFIYVKDITKVMLWMLDHPEVNGFYNVGTGKARSFEDMAKAIYSAIGKPPHIHYIDMPEEIVAKYQYFTEANVQRLRSAGYSAPFMTLEEGVKDYLGQHLLKEDPYL